MENQRLKELAGLLTEKKEWSAKVTASTKWKPAEGFFTGSHTEIVKGLLAAPGGAKKAMSRLNFFINREGKKLEGKDKERLEKAKDALEKKLAALKEDVAATARRAGIIYEKKDEPMDDEPDMDMDGGPDDMPPMDDKAPKAPKADKAPKAEKEDDEDEDDLPKIVKKIAKTTCKKFKLGDAKGEGKECDEIEKLLMQVYNAGLKDGEKGGKAAPKKDEKAPKADKKDEPKDEPMDDDLDLTESFNLSAMSDAEVHKAYKKYSAASGKGGKAEDAHKRVSAELKKRGLKADIFKKH